MGNVLVIFYSKTGNTKAMAEFVAQGARLVSRINVRLKNIEEATADDLFWCDGLAVGSPTHLGSIPWTMKKWWDDNVDSIWQKIDGKFGCAFSSSAGLGGGPELTCMGLLTVLLNYGFIVFGVTDYVAERRTLHYGAAFPGPPEDKAKIDICKRLGQRLSEWVSCYVDGNRQMHPLKAKYIRSV
jgi:NAD(P)H dehydrogenase (quinone)